MKRHPLALLRDKFDPARVVPAARLKDLPPDGRVTVAGLVLVRQRPGSASGVIFMTLEDRAASPISSSGRACSSASAAS